LKQENCCFTGHRPTKLSYGYNEAHPDCQKLKTKLAEEIEQMLEKGVTTFITGLAQGTDIWAAETVLDLKQSNSKIRLTAVVPHEGQANNWSEHWRERYFQILEQSDETVVLQSHYIRGCMHKRNRYMVDRSAHIIAVFNGSSGGSKYTVDYAIKQGIHLVIIDPDDMTRKEIPSLRDFRLIKI
jgi:uncharacterized phage-like protein YoqJ